VPLSAAAYEPPDYELRVIGHENNFFLPGNMRGVILRPDPQADGLIQEQAFDDIAELSINTVIIETCDRVNTFYNTDMNKSEQPDYLLTAINSAGKRGFNVYLTFGIDTSWSINTLITQVHKFTLKYPCDGIIFTDYYSARNEKSFKRYMSFGAGVGYDNWLYDTTENYFKTAADTVRLTDNSVAVGIMLNNFSSIANTAGFADTRAFVKSGYADFAMVNAPDALTDLHVPIPFEEITQHWGEICHSAQIPMYIIHHNQNIGLNIPGWRHDDQLLRQLSSAKDLPAYQGSVFNSYPDLMENRLNSTRNIKKFFDDRINEESLFEDLTINTPDSFNFATHGAYAVFQGTHDDNFDVFLNEEEIRLNEAGNFYLEKPLDVGVNEFTLRHKGQVITYTINRQILALHSIDSSIANGRTLEVEGGTTITIGATAYRGATVTASINGLNIKLTEQEYNLDDPTLNMDFAPFVGRYTVPDGIIRQSQNLGAISIRAEYDGFVRTAQGASVRVAALPEPPPPPSIEMPIVNPPNWGSQTGSGEVVGRIGAVRGRGESVRYVKVLEDNTPVYASNTTGTENDPNISRLPEGTIDYYRSTAGNFHITENGKRIHADASVLEDGFGMGENALVMLAGGTTGRDSYFRIALGSRSSFNIKAADLNFTTAWGGNFNVSDFNATHIHVDFDNVTSVTQLPSFEHNHVFSGGRWENVEIAGVPKFRLILELRRQGVYAGHYARYNSDGELLLTFKITTGSLAGKTVVIDPGHGVTSTGFDPGAVGHIHEYDANIAVARALQSRLTSLGATAIVLATDETFFATFNRPDYARELGCDLYLSLHANSVTGSPSARGQEVWYFTPYSQPLAAAISASVAGYFQNHVYEDSVLRDRGAKNGIFWVTLAQDFPSVLVEMGFVTNMEDAMALASQTHQTGIANAIADGIQTYLSRAA
jgi:N-acetylmuramoyl-L-alanine amidase